MAFWSGETLAARLPNLISDFDPSLIDCNGYTLRMGSNYFCTSDGKQPVWDRAKRQELKPRGSFPIPGGQFAFLETKEVIEVPREAMAFISVKATIKWEGLINISGFHVDPGYKGKLIFSVYNAGPSPIILEEGMPLFLIWYAFLDNPKTQKIRQGNSGKAITNELIKPMSREILSLQSMSKEISELRFSMRIQAIIFGVAVALFVTLIGSISAFIIQRGLIKVLETPQAAAIDAAKPNAQPSTASPTPAPNQKP